MASKGYPYSVPSYPPNICSISSSDEVEECRGLNRHESIESASYGSDSLCYDASAQIPLCVLSSVAHCISNLASSSALGPISLAIVFALARFSPTFSVLVETPR